MNGDRNTGSLLASGEKDMEMRQRDETPQDATLAFFERLARDPKASVEKIERLMALWERGEARKAEAAFNTAMTAAQQAIRPVITDEYNEQTRSKYPSYEALDAVARPIYTQHGFGLSFDTGYGAPPDSVRVLCYATHAGGHARTYHVDMPADGKGPKGGDVMTKTHATGSAMSYGQRYLLKFIFNIPVKDDDGNAASRKKRDEPAAPEGYDKWLATLQEEAMTGGFPAFSKMWGEPTTETFRKYLAQTAPKMLANIKTKAREVKP